MEDKQRSWKEPLEKHFPENLQYLDDNVNDIPVRGTRRSSHIYGKSIFAVFEPVEFKEVEKDDKWVGAMRGELRMIEKSGTW